MALIYETRTVEVTDYEFVVTEDDAGSLYGIYTDGLRQLDIDALEDADENGTGETLREKLEGYRLKTNGFDGFETYKASIFNIDNYIQAVRIGRIKGSTPSKIASLEDRVDELEAG